MPYLCSGFKYTTMKDVKRIRYLMWLSEWKDKQIIKVITGIRRCGKSTLMRQFQTELQQAGVEEDQIINLNFEDMSLSHLLTAEALHQYIVSRLQEGRMNYIFMDEVQLVEDFQRAVNSLYLRTNVDIYITGSNAGLLSGELATLLAGRYVSINMLPFSYEEYAGVVDGYNRDVYDRYISESSFPYALNLEKTQLKDYLSSLYDTIVLRDIVSRNQLQSIDMLNRVIRFLADNIGNLTSAKSIADTFASNGRKVSSHTIDSYMQAILSGYLFYRVGRYDVHGKEHLKVGAKYYIADIGLRNWMADFRQGDAGRVLENIVFLELFRRRKQISVGKAGQTEIDFVCTDANSTEYYQVALSVQEEQTLQRELTPLRDVKDHYPRYLLTLDHVPPVDHNGIRQLYVIDWLLGK